MMNCMETDALVIDGFAQLGIHVAPAGAAEGGTDLILDADGVPLALQVKRHALVTESLAERFLRAHTVPAVTLLVVGDRVTDAARKILTAGRAGYYDLRGRLALRAPGIVIDAEVEPLQTRPTRSHALSGRAGLEIACALLMHRERRTAVRELSRQLGRSASTVSEVLAALRREGLVDAKNAVPDTRLFWQVADHWTAPRTYLARLPSPDRSPSTQALRLGWEDAERETGWALTDSAAAAAYGAPLAFRSGQVLDFYVPDQAILHRATTLLGTVGTPSQARATVRVAPVLAAVQHRVGFDTNPMGWPLAHPLFVALDLTQDVGRGREILEAWTPGDRWTRVW